MKTQLFLHIAIVSHHGKSARRAEWIARGTGTELYRSKVCAEAGDATKLARRWFERNAERYEDTTRAGYIEEMVRIDAREQSRRAERELVRSAPALQQIPRAEGRDIGEQPERYRGRGCPARGSSGSGHLFRDQRCAFCGEMEGAS